MNIEIFKEPVYKRYYTTPSSPACLYTILYLFLLIFLPLFIAYNSSSFWLKDNIIYEQPNIQYTYNSMFRYIGTRSNQNFQVFWSTSPIINQIYSTHLRPSLIRSNEIDENKDGLIDRFEINLLIPLEANENIIGFDALLFSEVRVQEKAKYIYDAVTHLTFQSGITSDGLKMLYFDGNLKIHQRSSLIARGGFVTPYPDSDSLFPTLSNSLSLSDVSFSEILMKSAARNLSLSYEENYHYFETFLSTATSSSPSTTCNISITLRIPRQQIIYSPAVSEVIKFAWIQYMSIFLVVSFLFYQLNSFIFSHQLLRTYSTTDLIIKKLV